MIFLSFSNPSNSSSKLTFSCSLIAVICSFNVAIMEAMMMEVPIIVTGEGGVKELVDHEVNGLLVSPKSPKVLAEAIKKLLNNPQLSCALSKASRERVIKDFSSEKSAKIITEFLSKN